MATPIARPITMPLSSGGLNPGNINFYPRADEFLPTLQFISDFKEILMTIIKNMENFRAAGGKLSDLRLQLLAKFNFDHTGENLLVIDSGWGLAAQVIEEEIIYTISALQSKFKEFIFPMDNIISSTGLSSVTIKYSLSNLLDITFSPPTAGKINISDIRVSRNLGDPSEQSYKDYLVKNLGPDKAREFLIKSVSAFFNFYKSLGFNFQNKISDKNLDKEISIPAVGNFLLNNKKIDEQELQRQDIFWNKFYEFQNFEVVKEVKQTISEVSLGKRSLSNNLREKIENQVFMRLVRDLKDEQDNLKIEELGQRLKAMAIEKRKVKIN